MLKFWTGSPFFVCLNNGSQILEICRSQIYEKLRSQISMLKFETGRQFFCVSEYRELDFKFSKEPNSLKIEEPKIFKGAKFMKS